MSYMFLNLLEFKEYGEPITLKSINPRNLNQNFPERQPARILAIRESQEMCWMLILDYKQPLGVKKGPYKVSKYEQISKKATKIQKDKSFRALDKRSSRELIVSWGLKWWPFLLNFVYSAGSIFSMLSSF